MTAHPLIPTKGFVSRLNVMRMNDNQLFMEEFGSIPMQPLSARDVSQLAHNKEKNRLSTVEYSRNDSSPCYVPVVRHL